MSVFSRGAKNAFRNTIRTVSITLILGLSLGMAVIMLVSLKTVQRKIDGVKSSIGNTVTVSPAGARGFEGGGEPLTTAQMATVQALPHVNSITETLNDRLQPSTDTSLASAIDPGTIGTRQGRFFARGGFGGGTNSATPRTFTVPISVIGTTDPLSTAAVSATQVTVTNGRAVDGNSDANEAMLGTALATKNSLAVGGTFTAYGNTAIKVVGIFDAGNQFANSGLVMPLKTVQRLSQQTDQLSMATVKVDSISNLASVTDAIKAKLGSAADVVNEQDSSSQALAPLESIHTVATYSLIGAVLASALILLLTMLMVVRERRREIGVLKAIGAGNGTVVSQFVTEALVLTGLGAVVGTLLGYVLSNPVLRALATGSRGGSGAPTGGFGGGGGFRAFGGSILGPQAALRNLTAVLDIHVVLYALAVTVGIAILGSAVPAWLIAQVRPSEVLRSE